MAKSSKVEWSKEEITHAIVQAQAIANGTKSIKKATDDLSHILKRGYGDCYSKIMDILRRKLESNVKIFKQPESLEQPKNQKQDNSNV